MEVYSHLPLALRHIPVGRTAGGGDLGAVDLVYVPEPSTLAMLVFGTLLALRRLIMCRKLVVRETHRKASGR